MKRRLFIVLMISSGCVFAQLGEIKGKVQDHYKAPIGRARVLLINVQSLEVFRADVASDGTFNFKNLRAGDYELRIAADAFVPYGKPIEIKRKTENLRITMRVDESKLEESNSR